MYENERTKVKFIFFFLFFCSYQSFATSVLSADQILEMTQQQDPVVTVKKLHRDNAGQDWRNAIIQIKSGNKQWLDVANALEKGAGTKGAEQLMDAVTRAIPENPSGVLHMLSEKNIFLNTENICSLPLISANDIADKKLQLNALNAVRAEPEGKNCAKKMQEAIFGIHSVPR
jgi:hypothetical protein